MPAKTPKTPEARLAEVVQLNRQLGGVGMPDECLQPVRAALADFARTGQGFSGTLAAPDTQIVFVCVFSTQAHICSTIRITSARK